MRSSQNLLENARDARSWAVAKLIQVEAGGAWANLARGGLSDLNAKDRALAVELLAGVTRRKATLDWYLAHVLKQPVESLTPAIRNNLRLAVYQLWFLSRIPESAAVNEAVKLAHRLGHKGVASLTNAVLRNLLRRRETIHLPNADKEPVEHLRVAYSLPAWIATQWWERFGLDASALGAWSIGAPRISLRANVSKTTRGQLLESLREKNIGAIPSAIVPEGIRLEQSVEPAAIEGYSDGFFYVQDEAAMLVSRVLDPRPHERIFDIGAAPGGKTSHIVELVNNQAEVWAIDRSEARLKRLEENCRRMGHHNIVVQPRDAVDLTGLPLADRILLDAPCSGLGVLPRKPDLRWNQNSENLVDLAHLQGRMLDEAIKYLKPGGILVYSTCTMTTTENQAVVKEFLARNPDIHPVDFTEHLPGPWHQDFEREIGGIQLRPDRHDVDGFFIAKLRRGMMESSIS
ncbi:MAG: 16S rRNA (cytosine(967)-C(5))-methyltransferase RsmB [Candidatus Sericytochromatia bacterium]|nr:16S rRNA (cytosine(967)-C(5))-methyltransferase RsmB [Candidatus Sericytochromatia bacterium]